MTISIVCPCQSEKNLRTFEIHVLGHPSHHDSSTALRGLDTLTESSSARDRAQLHGIRATWWSQRDMQCTRRTQKIRVRIHLAANLNSSQDKQKAFNQRQNSSVQIGSNELKFTDMINIALITPPHQFVFPASGWWGNPVGNTLDLNFT